MVKVPVQYALIMISSVWHDAVDDWGATTLSVVPATPGSPFGPGGPGSPLSPLDSFGASEQPARASAPANVTGIHHPRICYLRRLPCPLRGSGAGRSNRRVSARILTHRHRLTRGGRKSVRVMRAGTGRAERQLGSSSKLHGAASAIYGPSKLARPGRMCDP